MERLLWVVDFVGGDVPNVDISPEFPEDMIVVADTHFVVVEATHDEVESIIGGYPYWRNRGHPADGKWINAGGDEVYIASGEVVDDPLTVLCALGVEIDDYARKYYDDILSNMNRVF